MVLGVFSRRIDAEDAIRRLEDLGFNPKDISIVMKDQSASEEIASSTGANVADGVVGGATTGGVLGGLAGLLIGVGAITIPGVGGLLIAGPVATALGLTGAAASTVSGALTGALAGGLVGGLVGLGVPEEDAHIYEDRVKAGAILLVVPATSYNEDEVKDVLTDYSADQVRVIGDTETSRLHKESVERNYQPAYFHDIDERPKKTTRRKKAM
jgi:hypothetical protein